MSTGPASAPRRPPSDFFSPDYAAARGRFREAARRAGATLHELPLSATGPRSEPLAIDVAWLGSPRAPRVLLHTSGIHGVEAYAGSAIQLALLERLPDVHASTAVALVHVLNPYGMAWSRRANENNVDLNRNVLRRGESYSGAPPLYPALDGLLNPRTPPRHDAFLLRALLRVLRHGYPAVKQAVAQGQYEFPQGLFYGGARLEEGPRLYLEWLASHLSHASAVLALDVHTGLGRRGEDTLLIDPGDEPPAGLAAALGGPLVGPATGDDTSYVVRGGLASGMRETLPQARVHAVVQEFGTCPVVKVISALRDENRAHFFGSEETTRRARQALLAALRLDDSEWRERVVSRGLAAARGAVAWLHEEDGNDM